MNRYSLLFLITDRLPGNLTVDHSARTEGAPWFHFKGYPVPRGRCLSVRLGGSEWTYYTPAAC